MMYRLPTGVSVLACAIVCMQCGRTQQLNDHVQQKLSSAVSAPVTTSQPKQAPAVSPPFDINRLIEHVTYQWRDLQVLSSRYSAAIHGTTLHFSSQKSTQPPKPLTVATKRICRGKKVLYTQPSPHGAVAWTYEERRIGRKLNATMTEWFATRAAGVEHLWEVQQVDGAGDLEVEVALGNLPYQQRDEQTGLVFGDNEQNGDKIYYGHMTVTDAAGLQIAVAAQRTNDGARFVVPDRYLQQAKTPIVLDPLIQSAFAMDAVVAANPGEDQQYPRVATNGNQYLVVWQDYRMLDGLWHIYGARLDNNGTLLDPTGIEIAVRPNTQQRPDVAYGNGSYLVVWQESGTSPATNGFDIYGARIDTSGTVLTPGGFKIQESVGTQQLPRVDYGGNQYLVVWQNSGGTYVGNDIGAARISSAGAVLDATPITIASGAGNQDGADVAANDDVFLVVYNDSANAGDVRGKRINSDGTTPDATALSISTGVAAERNPSVASNGTNWLVAWDDQRNYALTSVDLYAAIIAANGTITPGGMKVSGWNGDEKTARIASDGVDYLVIWADGSTVVTGTTGGMWIEDDGTMGSAIGFQVFVGGHTDIIYNATTSHYYVPRYTGGLNDDIVGRRILASGAAVDATDVTISRAYNSQYYPAVAFDGSNYLVVWSDSRNWRTSGWDIYGVFVNASGTVVSGNAHVICNADGTQSYPAVAYDGTNYYVVWEDKRPGTNYYDVYGGRVAKNGTTLDGDGQQLSGQLFDQRYPRIAFDDSQNGNYLVVWQDYRNSAINPARGWDIFGTRVRSGDGFVFEQLSGIKISSQLTNEIEPDVAFDGTNFFVVWTDERDGAANRDIYGARVAQSGTLLDANGVVVMKATGVQSNPSILFNGVRYFMVWQDARTSANSFDIYGVYMDKNLVFSSATGFGVYTGVGSQTLPRVAAIGQAPLIVFQDRSSFGTHRWDVRGIRVDGHTVLESFLVSENDQNEVFPTIATGGTSEGLVGYMFYDQPYKTVRVMGRRVQETCANNNGCAAGSLCATGLCQACNTDLLCGVGCKPCGAGTYCGGLIGCLQCNVADKCGPSCTVCSVQQPFCNGQTCVACLSDDDCAVGRSCMNNSCVVVGSDGGLGDGGNNDKDGGIAINDGQVASDMRVRDGLATKDGLQGDAKTTDGGKKSDADNAALDAGANGDAIAGDDGMLHPPPSGCGCEVSQSYEGAGYWITMITAFVLIGIRNRSRRKRG